MKAKLWKWTVWATLIICASTGIAVLQLGCGSNVVSSEQPQPLRLAIQNNTICALILIAEQEKLFQKKGVEVQVIRKPSGKLALQSMLSGDADIAAAADMPITSNSFNRSDFAMFATIASTDKGAWIVARSDRGIQKPEDLKGKVVATQKNSAVHFFLSMFLAANDIAEDELEIRYMKAVDLPEALVSGEIDAFSMRNPFINQAKEKLGDRAIEFFGVNVYRQTFNLVAKKNTLAERKNDIHRLLEALVAAENLVATDEARAKQVAAAGLGEGRESELFDDWKRYTFTVNLDQSIFPTLENQARWAIANGITEGKTIPNYLEFMEIKPLRDVRPEAVTIIY